MYNISKFLIIALCISSISLSCKNKSNKTGNTIDTSSPAIVSFQPSQNEVGVSVNAETIFSFSHEIDPMSLDFTTFNIQADGKTITGKLIYKDKVATFTPDNELEYYTDYSVSISSEVSSKYGYAMEQDYHWNFRTVEYGTVPNPVIEPIEGLYEKGVFLKIKCDELDAGIVYTLDGTEPVMINGVIINGDSYQTNGVYLISKTTVVKAFAWKDGSIRSETVKALFRIKAPMPYFYPPGGDMCFAGDLAPIEILSGTNATIYFECSVENEGAWYDDDCVGGSSPDIPPMPPEDFCHRGDELPDPTVDSRRYDPSMPFMPFKISYCNGTQLRIKAYSVGEGVIDSGVSEAVFTVDYKTCSTSKWDQAIFFQNEWR